MGLAVVATERESARPPRLKASAAGVGGARGMGGHHWKGAKRDSSMGLIGGTVQREGVGADEEVAAIVLSLSFDTKETRIVCCITLQLC
jgi:hypothetical protein